MRGFFMLAIIVLAGCGGRTGVKSAATNPQTTREWLSRYSELKLSRASENAFLRNELFRIEAESGLPKQLAKAENELDGKSSANGPLAEITSAEQLNYLDRRLAYVFPQSEFTIAERHITEIERLCKDYKKLRDDLDRFSEAKDHSIDLAFDEGSLFSNQFIPCVETAIKLELTAGGLALRKSDWANAKKAFQRVWGALEVLAAQPHLESRVLSVQLRVAALRLLEMMLQAPECNVNEVRSLRDALETCIHEWPGDDRVWRGERARALHLFEMMRDGQALSLVDDELQAAIDDHGGSKDFGVWLHAHIDADEVYYLENMRKLIEACQVSFADRNATIRSLNSDLKRLARSAADPLLSRVMLFDDVEPVMRLQASDRLHCEVMLIALDHALGESPNSKALSKSPLTGRDYRITRRQRIIRVDGDSEMGELGYAVSAPRYDLAVADALEENHTDDSEAEVDERPKKPEKSARRPR